MMVFHPVDALFIKLTFVVNILHVLGSAGRTAVDSTIVT